MTEFHTRKPIDNSRLVRPVAPHGLRKLLGLVALCALLAGVAMLYAWQHFAYIQMRYQLEALKSQRAQAVELNQNLKLEEAGLRAPGPHQRHRPAAIGVDGAGPRAGGAV